LQISGSVSAKNYEIWLRVCRVIARKEMLLFVDHSKELTELD